MSQKQNSTNQKKGGNKMYKLNYKEHIILKQAAFIIMKNYNQKQYNSDKPNKQFIKYNQTLQLLYKKSKEELLDIIDRYLTSQEKQNNKKLIQHNQSQIIIPKLQNLTDTQVEQIATKLQELEKHYYLQLDTDYNSKQSIIQSYQQLIAYKYYNIEIPRKETEETILIGNLEILEKGATQC